MDALISCSTNNGSIDVITSKSYAHRALICASLCFNQVSTIKNVYLSDDVKATINCLSALGAKFEFINNDIIVYGIDKYQNQNNVILNANESGSTLRFLIPISTYLCTNVEFLGSSKLLKRPLNVYQELYNTNNLLFNLDDYKLKLNGFLNNNYYKIPGNISSQFISGLLFLLPLLNHDSIIEIYDTFESYNYVLMSIEVLKQFNIKIEMKDNLIIIKGNQQYKSTDYEIEADYSQAAFFIVLGLINNDITIKGLNPNSLQGDKEILLLLDKLNANYNFDDNNNLIVKPSKLNKNITFSLKNCPDLGPILMVLNDALNLNINFIDDERLVYKESNRLKAMQINLDNYHHQNNIDSFNDHRIAMAFAIYATISKHDIIIKNFEAINKSYPTFIDSLKTLSINIKVNKGE